MTISKRIREQAALVLSAWASSELKFDDDIKSTVATLGVSDQAVSLALETWGDVDAALGGRMPIMSPEINAEAESLLRCGWSPGDSL